MEDTTINIIQLLNISRDLISAMCRATDAKHSFHRNFKLKNHTDENIARLKGMRIHDKEVIFYATQLSKYAQDIQMFFQGEVNIIEEAFEELEANSDNEGEKRC